jgi:chromatin assembly factor 1 subunit B
MKVKTLQVLWHEKKPVLSVDFDPATGLLASCGTDKEIKLWRVGEDAEGNPDVTHEETLTAHTKTVNCVRFSPGGDALASGGDAGEVIVWRPAPSDKRVTNQHGDVTSWRTSAVLRGHSDDVQDLAWAPEGAGIVTGSVDNECIVWDVPKAKGALRLQGHTHYVQGVSWDPHGEYVVSQSGDRTARVFASRGMGASHQMLSARWCKHLACQKVLKSTEESPDPASVKGENKTAVGNDAGVEKPPRAPLFHDDTMGSFFRRPAWSPCGSFLAVPAGVHREHAGAKEQHCTYLYARDAFHRPALRLPGIAPAACVRFSPVFYERDGEAEKTRPRTPEKRDAADAADAADASPETANDDGDVERTSSSAIDLPFRVLFAVCTTDTVTVYDSSSDAPVAFVGGLHYAAITDAAWSPDGYTLAVSSSDGYCSILRFSEREIGKPMPEEKLPSHLRKLTPAARVKAAREAAEAAERRAAAAAEDAAAKARAKAEAKAETFPAETSLPPSSTEPAMGAPKRVAPEPVTQRVAPEPVVGVGDGAAAFASASFEARAPKHRRAPTSLADAPSAKAPKRVAPTPLS